MFVDFLDKEFTKINHICRILHGVSNIDNIVFINKRTQKVQFLFLKAPKVFRHCPIPTSLLPHPFTSEILGYVFKICIQCIALGIPFLKINKYNHQTSLLATYPPFNWLLVSYTYPYQCFGIFFKLFFSLDITINVLFKLSVKFNNQMDYSQRNENLHKFILLTRLMLLISRIYLKTCHFGSEDFKMTNTFLKIVKKNKIL